MSMVVCPHTFYSNNGREMNLTMLTVIHSEASLLRERLKKYQTREVAVWAISVGASICTLLLARTLYTYSKNKRRGSIKNDDQRDQNHKGRNKHARNNKNKKTNQIASKDNGKSDDRKVFLTIRSARSQLVSARVWRQFEEAAYRIRNNSGDATSPKNITTLKKLTNGDKLLFYALYKQIVDGNAPAKMIHSRTNWNIMAEKAKFDAWTRMRDIPISAAIDHYITAVTHFSAPPNVKSATNIDNDDDDDSITSYSESGDHDDAMEVMFAPATQSRPGIENGGYDDDDENDNGNGKQQSLGIQLLNAVGRNDLESVQRIVNQSKSRKDKKVDVNYSDETGQTALHLAADRGNTAIVQVLILSGGNVNACDDDGISVLQAAVIAGHVSTCLLLLSHNANPDQADHDGDTPRSCCEDDIDNTDMMQLFSKY